MSTLSTEDIDGLAMSYAVSLHGVHGRYGFEGGADADARLVATYHAIRRALTTPEPDPAITDLQHQINNLEEYMTAFGEQTNRAIEELRVAVNDATNRVAAKLAELARQDQITADQLTPLVDELNQIGADPQNPVPEPAPEPGI